jgi:hypothetical protein
MKKTRNILAWIGALVTASMVSGSAAYAQWSVAGAPGTIINSPVTPLIGINTGPIVGGVVGTACDPLEISTSTAVPPAIRFSDPMPTYTVAGAITVCSPNYAQLGYVMGNGAGGFSSINNPYDFVLANQGTAGGDVIIASRSTSGGSPVGKIRFSTGNADAERMVITNAGKVGIGTSSPSQTLDVTGSIHASSNILIGNKLQANGSFGTTGDVLAINGSGIPTWGPIGTGSYWVIDGNTEGAVKNLGTKDNYDLPFITNNTEKMRITTGGNVGIGTNNPTEALHVVGNVRFSGALMPNNSAGSSGNVLVSAGSGSPPTWATASTFVSGQAWALIGNSGTTAGTDFVGTSDDENLVLKAYNAKMIELISSGTSTTVGQIVIGGGSATGGAVNTLNGVTQINGNTTVSGTFTTSDARLKEHVVTLDNALAKVMKLRGVEYDFRPGVAPELNLPQTHQIGLIAQEVEEVVPEVINEGGNGYKAVAYQNLVGLLVESTKEQQSIIESQRTTIDNLSTRLARLEAMIDPSLKPITPGTKEEGKSIQLEQNSPNPFDRTTIIRYVVPNGIGNAEMVLFEAGTGREVERFIIANRGAGEVTVSVAGLASGSYVYGIVADGRLVQTRTMVVAR